jgi:nucleoside-diphosphate-sugar epimerase
MYITDAIKAMFYVLLYGAPGEAVNIVTEDGEASVKELANIMAESVADKKIEVVFDYNKERLLRNRCFISCNRRFIKA